MVKPKSYFTMAFLFSGLWHICLISTVSIIEVPNIKMRDPFTEVSFLGPILEKTAFDMMADEYRPKAETLYRTSVITKHDVDLEVTGPERYVEKNFTGNEYDKKYLMAKNITEEDKDRPKQFIQDRSIFYHIGDKSTNTGIEGPVRNRTLVFRPPLPYFSKGIIGDETSVLAKYRIILRDDGSVESVEPVILSGYPHVDIKCQVYLKQWKFGPRLARNESEEDWGIVTLDIKLE